jgi:tetratricopeptide (TPR) repeat protein
LRVGKAALRLGSIDVALEHLEMALFLEERMFYVGQILLARGQAKDLKKDRKGAKEDYQEVLRLPTAYLDREAAKDYLKSPFKN